MSLENLAKRLAADLSRAYNAGDDTMDINIYDLGLLLLVLERAHFDVHDLKETVQQFKDKALSRIREQAP